VKLGIENRKQTIAAAALGVMLVLVLAWEFMPSSSTIASTTVPTPAADTGPLTAPAGASSASKRNSAPVKKERPAQSLDPTLHLQQLAYTEQIKYEGSGRNIFISQADPVIPVPVAPGTAPGGGPAENTYHAPPVPPAPPIQLKFFGFASKPGEPKKIFLSKGEDVFIAGEGEIIDRRYKIVKISATSVEIQDVVSSGPPQSIPLTQG
jgi:hypothetical protein